MNFKLKKIFVFIFVIFNLFVFFSSSLLAQEDIVDSTSEVFSSFGRFMRSFVTWETTSGDAFDVPMWVLVSFWTFTFFMIYLVLSYAPFFNKTGSKNDPFSKKDNSINPRKLKLVLSGAITIALTFGTNLIFYWNTLIVWLGYYGYALFIMVSFFFIWALYLRGKNYSAHMNDDYISHEDNSPHDPHNNHSRNYHKKDNDDTTFNLNFVYEPDNPSVNDKVQFVNNSDGLNYIKTIVWDFGDGKGVNKSNPNDKHLHPKHSYKKPGKYNVQLYHKYENGYENAISKHITILNSSGNTKQKSKNDINKGDSSNQIKKTLDDYIRRSDKEMTPKEFIEISSNFLSALKDLYDNGYDPTDDEEHIRRIRTILSNFINFLEIYKNKVSKKIFNSINNKWVKLYHKYNNLANPNNKIKTRIDFFEKYKDSIKDLDEKIDDLFQFFTYFHDKISKFLIKQKFTIKSGTKKLYEFNEILEKLYDEYNFPNAYDNEFKKLLKNLDHFEGADLKKKDYINKKDQNTNSLDSDSDVNLTSKQKNDLIEVNSKLKKDVRNKNEKLQKIRDKISKQSNGFNNSFSSIHENGENKNYERLVEDVDKLTQDIDSNSSNFYNDIKDLISDLEDYKNRMSYNTKEIHQFNGKIERYVERVYDFIKEIHNFKIGPFKGYLSIMKKENSLLDLDNDPEMLVQNFIENTKKLNQKYERILEVKENIIPKNNSIISKFNNRTYNSKKFQSFKKDLKKILKEPSNFSKEDILSHLKDLIEFVKTAENYKSDLIKNSTLFYELKKDIDKLISNNSDIINSLNESFEHGALKNMMNSLEDWKRDEK
ncbi:MAG: PKD domain-containing protein [bacterium]